MTALRHHISAVRRCAYRLHLRLLPTCLLLTCGFGAVAQSEWWNGDPSLVTPIGSSAVVAERPLNEIGLQKSEIDSASLKLTLSQSMADVLAYNTAIYVKQYGRGSLATVSFRGTAASHTQVLWNGIKINSPMLGMTDFSTIPSYFTDRAGLLHGSSSLSVSGGGLGGAVILSTTPLQTKGLDVSTTIGVGSFSTLDAFLRVDYGAGRWRTSTRASATVSKNDFRYRNYNKKEYTYDEAGIPTCSYYPVDTNSCGAIRDLNLLQEFYYKGSDGGLFALKGWFTASRRGVPFLSVDYRPGAGYTNEQGERSARVAAEWNRTLGRHILEGRAGWLHTRGTYDFARNKGNGTMAAMISSRSLINTLNLQFQDKWILKHNFMLTAQLAAYQHFVTSEDHSAANFASGSAAASGKVAVGYIQARFESSSYLGFRWNVTPAIGIAGALREELYGDALSPIIPVINLDWQICRNLTAKASASRNYRYPSLNDLYFQPGGNPDLLPESGLSYDAGLNYSAFSNPLGSLSLSANWFDSYIDNWIVWIPTFKGFWTPRNVLRVHAYGIETSAKGEWKLSPRLKADCSASFAWTPSINQGDPASWADEAIGKQLVYVPLYSSSAVVSMLYKNWKLTYKWCWYSERYTTSDNDMSTKIGRVLPYFMNDIVLEKSFACRGCSRLALKLAVNNIFNEEYESVLHRPMPGRNFEFFVEIKPDFYKKHK